MKLVKFAASIITVLVLLTNFVHVTETMKVKLTNLQCNVLDKSFGTFKKCILKAIARDTVRLQVELQLHQLPLDNITVNGELFQKGNGFRPFMYNTTVDFCQFLKRPSRYMFWKIIYDAVRPYSNVNHTCPFNHDMIVHDLILKADMFKLIPFPANDYMITINLGVYNQYKIQGRGYFKIFD